MRLKAIESTTRTLAVLCLTLLVGLMLGAPLPVLGDGVYSSGLLELGDGQAPPGTPGMADITADPAQSGPDWGELFNADGSARDDYPFDEQGNPVGNGIADYVELYGGEWVVFTSDYVSMGSDFEGDALTADGRVVNGVVQASHDLGNAYIYSALDASGNLVLYAAAERLGNGDSNLEIEFNQAHFRLGHGGYGRGEPWEVLGSRMGGDVLVKLTFYGGALTSVEANAWDGEGWIPLAFTGGEGCDGTETLCAVCNSAAIDGGDWNEQQLDPGRFAEVGINVGALLGAQPLFTTVRLRTPEDAAFGYFAEGN